MSGTVPGAGLDFTFFVNQPGHFATIQVAESAAPETNVWYPGPEPAQTEMGGASYFNAGLFLFCDREWIASNNTRWTSMTVLWFDLSWMATTMYVQSCFLNLRVQRLDNDDNYLLHGEWFSDSNMAADPYAVRHTHFARDPGDGEAAFSPVELPGIGDGWQALNIELQDADEHMNYGGYVGIRLWLGSGDPSGLNLVWVDTRYNSGIANDPQLALALTCTDPDAEPALPEAFARPFDPRYRDRLPRSSVHQSAAWKSQIATEIEAELRPRSKRRVRK